MKYVRLAAVSVAILPWLLSVAEGCTCARGLTVCDEYARATAVFVGVVSDISRPRLSLDESNRGEAFLGKVVRFSVEQVYKGLESSEVSVQTGNGGGDCGYQFEAGKRYLVYCGSANGKLGTNICSRTKVFSEASEDLDYLRGLPESASKSRLSGTIIQHTSGRDINGFRKNQPMSGVKVVVTGSNRQFEAFSDDQGAYKIIGLPPGKYTVRPMLPGNLRLERWDGKDVMEAVVPPNGCASADLTVETNGGIAGRILDSDGNPADGIQVDLVPVQLVGTTSSAEVVESKIEKTDKEGRYQFIGIGPGKYYLGVNLRNDPTGEFPYNRTYYPGTAQRDKAITIELSDGEKLNGYDVFLPPAIALRTVEGVFLWSNGQPVEKGSIYFADSPEASRMGRVYSSAKSDAKGRFSIKAFDGLECWIHGHTMYSGGDRTLFIEIAPVKIVVNYSTPRVKLIAPIPGDGSDKK
jgi:hypothetical protein